MNQIEFNGILDTIIPPKKIVMQGLESGVLDSAMSALFVQKKNEIQAKQQSKSTKTSESGKKIYMRSFIASNIVGHILVNSGHPILASAMVVGIESKFRPYLTKSKTSGQLIGLILARELTYWGGVNMSNKLTKTGDSYWKSFSTQLIFSGIFANIFDTLAGQYSNNNQTKEPFNKIKLNPKDFLTRYKESLGTRCLGCVVTPFIAFQWVYHPKSPRNNYS